MKYITFFLISVFVFVANGQEFKYDKYGYVNSLEFKELIKQRNYQLVSTYDTISKTPLEIVAKVVKNDVMYFIDTNGNELPYRDLLSSEIKDREARLNKPFKDAEKKYNAYINDIDLDYERFKKDDFYGLIRKKDKKVVIEPKYKSIWRYKGGIVSLKENGLYGIADTLGKIIVPIKYESIQLCMIDSNKIERFIGYRNNLGTLINRNGQELFPPVFSKINGFAVDGLLSVSIVENGNRKMGLIDKNGKLIIEPKQSFVSYFPNTNLLITENDRGLRGLLNKQGKVLFDAKLEYIDITADKGNIAFTQDKKQGVLDREGNVLVKPIYDKILDSYNDSGFWIVGKEYLNNAGDKKNRYGVVNSKNKLIIPIDYDDLVKCSSYFIGKKEDKYFVINTDGVIIKELNYKNIRVVDSRRAIVLDSEGKYGVISIGIKGNDIINVPLEYTQMESCGNGYFDVSEGIINLENELILPKKWNRITYTNKLALRNKGVFIVESGYGSSVSRDCIDRYANRYAEKSFKE